MEAACNILQLQARRGIFDYIQQCPGLHGREISRRLDVPFTTLQYHLRYLEKRELVKSKDDGKYTRYFVSSSFGRNEKNIVNLLHKKTPRSVIFYLLTFVVGSQAELSKSLEKHPTTIEFHLKKMEKMGVITQVKGEYGVIKLDFKPFEIERLTESNEVLYRLEDPYMIYHLLMNHKEKLLEDEDFKQMFDYIDYMVKTGIPEKVTSPKDGVEAVYEVFCEMFPLPFRA